MEKPVIQMESWHHVVAVPAILEEEIRLSTVNPFLKKYPGKEKASGEGSFNCFKFVG